MTIKHPPAGGKKDLAPGESSALHLHGQAFHALSLEQQREQLRLADASMRYRMILDAADGRDLTHSLASQDLFLTIKELGRDEVPELVAMSSGEQLTAFIDLDCWKGDLIDAPEALQWLALAMTEGEEAVLTAAAAIDFELLVLIMAKFVRVLRGPEAFHDEDNPPDLSKCVGSYEVDFLQQKYARLVSSILDCLYRLDSAFYMHLMEALRWELLSSLEENAYQGRCERLQDLGFPDALQAAEIYAPLDPATFEAASYRRHATVDGTAPAPGFALSIVRRGDLLGRVLSMGIGAATGWDLVYLANKMMVADRIDCGDRDALKTAMDKVYGYLNLALEHLCHNDAERAAQLLENSYLQPLFQLGYSLTLSLQQRARRLRSSSLGPWLDGVWAMLSEALSAVRPLYPLALDTPGAGGTRSFRDLSDVERVAETLASIEAARRLFEEHFPFRLPAPDDLDLCGCQPDQFQGVGLRHFFLTAVANRLSGRPFDITPLPARELAGLHYQVCKDKTLNNVLREEIRTWIGKMEPDAWPFVEACLHCWNDTLCPLLPERLDARFLDGLLVRLS